MTLCSQCHINPARSKQRNCLECHAKANRIYRENQKLERRALRGLVKLAVKTIQGRAA